METKNTDDLEQELLEAPDLDRFLEQNRGRFVSGSLPDYLLELLHEKNMTKSMLAKAANMSEIYLHQVFAGQRNLSRNRLICVCFGLSATLEQTQELLKCCGHAQLYPRNRRDTVIIFGLSHRMTLFEVNDKLLAAGERPLF